MQDMSLRTEGGLEGDVHLIGDLNAVVGLEAKTVRFYEREGLLKPQRLGHLRVYSKDDVERLKVIKFLRQFDLSLQLIKSLLARHNRMQVSELPQEAKDAVSDQLARRKAEVGRLESLLDEIRGRTNG